MISFCQVKKVFGQEIGVSCINQIYTSLSGVILKYGYGARGLNYGGMKKTDTASF